MWSWLYSLKSYILRGKLLFTNAEHVDYSSHRCHLNLIRFIQEYLYIFSVTLFTRHFQKFVYLFVRFANGQMHAYIDEMPETHTKSNQIKLRSFPVVKMHCAQTMRLPRDTSYRLKPEWRTAEEYVEKFVAIAFVVYKHRAFLSSFSFFFLLYSTLLVCVCVCDERWIKNVCIGYVYRAWVEERNTRRQNWALAFVFVECVVVVCTSARSACV